MSEVRSQKTIWKQPVARVERVADLPSAILAARGIGKDKQKRFLAPNYQQDLADPYLLKGMKQAVERTLKALDQDQKIIIYGDYDIDGLTAASLMLDVLSRASRHVEIYIPDRFEEGYGLHADALRELQKKGAELVITVDCGISSAAEVAVARKVGLDVIVTDHHTVPEVIPEAVAVLNPKLPGSKYPYRDLAGVGVAFTLVRALTQARPELLPPGQEKWLLDLVALGTICDVVELTGENRVLAQYGLRVLAKTRRIGLQELARVAGVELAKVGAEDLGFRFGPRLNAAGRLEHAKKALRLLTCSDRDQAAKYANELDGLNRERQQLTADIFEAANKQASKYQDDAVLVLADSEWSHGVAGIVAAKISEKWHKPTLIIQVLGDTAKGSARSFGDINVIEAITSCAKLLTRYGGHAFAAGVSLDTNKIDQFRERINEFAAKHYSDKDFAKVLVPDVELLDSLIDLTSFDSLSNLAPFGNSNPQPLFVTTLKLQEYRFVGQDMQHTKFRFSSSDRRKVDGISFFSAHKWPEGLEPAEYEVAYHLAENIWQDRRSAQIMVVDLRPVTKK